MGSSVVVKCGAVCRDSSNDDCLVKYSEQKAQKISACRKAAIYACSQVMPTEFDAIGLFEKSCINLQQMKSQQ